jgi:hypothetical protein
MDDSLKATANKGYLLPEVTIQYKRWFYSSHQILGIGGGVC